MARKFECLCGEIFDKKVWHCSCCAHHWPLDHEACLNCYKPKSLASWIEKRSKAKIKGYEYLVIRIMNNRNRSERENGSGYDLDYTLTDSHVIVASYAHKGLKLEYEEIDKWIDDNSYWLEEG